MRLDVLNKPHSYEVPSWFCEQENITGHECEQVGESDTIKAKSLKTYTCTACGAKLWLIQSALSDRLVVAQVRQ